MLDKITEFLDRQQVEFDAFYKELAKTYTRHKTLNAGDVVLYEGRFYRVIELFDVNKTKYVKMLNLRAGREVIFTDKEILKGQG